MTSPTTTPGLLTLVIAAATVIYFLREQEQKIVGKLRETFIIYGSNEWAFELWEHNLYYTSTKSGSLIRIVFLLTCTTIELHKKNPLFFPSN